MHSSASLDDDVQASVWRYGVFQPSGTTLATLVKRARESDFAALFLSPDDTSIVRGQYLKTPRDNVLLELGLFIGQLGPERVFLLAPKQQIDLPTDLQGVTVVPYRVDRDDDDFQNAVNPAATDIRPVTRRLGRRQRAMPSEGDSTGSRAPSPEVLKAIGRVGSVATEHGATLEIQRAGQRFKIAIVDSTRLGTSVSIDLREDSAVRALDHLCTALLLEDRG